MAIRICIEKNRQGSQAAKLQSALAQEGVEAHVRVARVFTITDLSTEQAQIVAKALTDPVTETHRINTRTTIPFSHALEIGFLPGVTDNVAATAKELIEDLLNLRLAQNSVFSSTVYFLDGTQNKAAVAKIADMISNKLIERAHIKNAEEYAADGGMDTIIPRVQLTRKPEAIEVDLAVSDEELITIGKQGILDPHTNQRRGPLALDLAYMHAIKKYFKSLGRNPTDIELESIAQTWSEHCKHTIFADPIDELKDGLFKSFIRKATVDIRKNLGDDDFCISVFSDNAGGIEFNDDFMVTHKVETHNSPSALDPFGGSITGIVGVNRDTIGFGMGAKPIANMFGFCVGRPEDTRILYRDQARTNPTLSPRRILDGIVAGVEEGGNCSGIPTPLGFLHVDDCYRGKPLVYVGTVGIMPKKLPSGKLSHEKKAQPGDHVVVIGGRVGKDGIHGATFSSEALTQGSTGTAGQIGDPITQKKLSDAIVKEARDKELYNSITDNGAGGISCSVAEMAKEAGGFIVDLEKVPLKYPGLQPWETWISESQERMTLSIPEEKLTEFMQLMESRGVEAVSIGTFTEEPKAVVRYEGKTILDLDMEFLHDGLPARELKTQEYPYNTEEPTPAKDAQEMYWKLIEAHNLCSHDYISKQYDHEVQANSVIKPIQGLGRVNTPAVLIKPQFDDDKGVALSTALYPRMSESSAYAMAANAIDAAIGTIVATGADPKKIALLDNFCWCSSTEPKRLRQLKEATQACYDYAVAFNTPYVSGKDSMFNDFRGFDAEGNPTKISVYPTLLISSIGIVPDAHASQTIDFKCPGDSIFILGETRSEAGGSEYYKALNHIGGKAPQVDAAIANQRYAVVHKLINKGLISSCMRVGPGGLAVSVSKMALAGNLGARIDVAAVPLVNADETHALFSETPSRFVFSVNPQHEEEVHKILAQQSFARIGVVTEEEVVFNQGEHTILKAKTTEIAQAYRRRFNDF